MELQNYSRQNIEMYIMLEVQKCIHATKLKAYLFGKNEHNNIFGVLHNSTYPMHILSQPTPYTYYSRLTKCFVYKLMFALG